VHPALQAIAEATRGTPYDGELWLVGGAVRDELLGIPHQNDFDIVTRLSSADLARLLFEKGLTKFAPVTYERFGTAMVEVENAAIEIVTARRESYDEGSRKPHVQPATLLEDAQRRDFTVNTLMRNLHSGKLHDPLCVGTRDLDDKVLRTPLDSKATFHDDPLRMLRAVRFRWQLDFGPAPGLYDAVRETRERLAIISAERIRDELVKVLSRPTAADALQDLMELGLLEIFAPELVAMVGVEQGNYHHLDVWNHTLLVVRNAGSRDLILTLAALLHDVGKPSTRTVDDQGRTRFFGHETVGAEMTRQILRRLKFPQKEVDAVALLVKNHMRLGSAPEFTKAAARRLVRDLGPDVDRLLDLVEADANGLKHGVRVLDLAPIRGRIAAVEQETPREVLHSPLTGREIMDLLGLEEGREVGKWKEVLTERVLEGDLAPHDKEGARTLLRAAYRETGSRTPP
jgi:poly(A) polymerase